MEMGRLEKTVGEIEEKLEGTGGLVTRVKVLEDVERMEEQVGGWVEQKVSGLLQTTRDNHQDPLLKQEVIQLGEQLDQLGDMVTTIQQQLEGAQQEVVSVFA